MVSSTICPQCNSVIYCNVPVCVTGKYNNDTHLYGRVTSICQI
jgi:hypothetical protein